MTDFDDTQPKPFNVNDLVPIEHQGERVVTTEILAKAYGTDIKHVQQNHDRNSSRFIEGVHYFKILAHL